MIPAIRSGFASTLGSLAAWWRAQAAGPGRAGRRVGLVDPDPSPTAELPITLHAEEALREFLCFALDGRRSRPLEDDELAQMQPLVDEGSTALERLELQARYLPRRPSLLPKLLSAMSSDGNSLRELADIIGGDPALLGNLLRVANSACYRCNEKPVESLERAVTRVGLDGIRSVIATALIHPVMAQGSGCFARFPETIWEQTQLAADAAELHARSIEHADGFAARLLALVCGLATNTVFRIVRDEVLVGRDESAKPAVSQLLDCWTVPMARRIATSWALGGEWQDALSASREHSALARSLFFGQVAGSQLVMLQRGRTRESSARATVLTSDSRRVQVDRLWNGLVAQADLRR